MMDRLIALLQRERAHAGFALTTNRSPEEISVKRIKSDSVNFRATGGWPWRIGKMIDSERSESAGTHR